MSTDPIADYLNGLEDGERVVETGWSCMHGVEGTVYLHEGSEMIPKGCVCVMWDNDEESGRVNMGTSVTHGTRRLHEQELLQ